MDVAANIAKPGAPALRPAAASPIVPELPAGGRRRFAAVTKPSGLLKPDAPDEPVLPQHLRFNLRYDADIARLFIEMRDPDTGQLESKMPSERAAVEFGRLKEAAEPRKQPEQPKQSANDGAAPALSEAPDPASKTPDAPGPQRVDARA